MVNGHLAVMSLGGAASHREHNALLARPGAHYFVASSRWRCKRWKAVDDEPGVGEQNVSALAAGGVDGDHPRKAQSAPTVHRQSSPDRGCEHQELGTSR